MKSLAGRYGRLCEKWVLMGLWHPDLHMYGSVAVLEPPPTSRHCASLLAMFWKRWQPQLLPGTESQALLGPIDPKPSAPQTNCLKTPRTWPTSWNSDKGPAPSDVLASAPLRQRSPSQSSSMWPQHLCWLRPLRILR